MTITNATLRATYLFPELLPDTAVRNLTVNAEAAPPILSFTRIVDLGLILQLCDIAVVRNDDVSLRIRYDDLSLEEETYSLPTIGTPNPYFLSAKNSLYYNLYSRAEIPDYQSYCSLWVFRPTIAHKLKFDMSLSPREQELAKKYDIYNLVKKGNHPLQWDYMEMREYQVLDSEIITFKKDVPEAGAIIRSLIPRSGEFLVLVSIGAERPPSAAHGTQIVISRDAIAGGEERYIVLPTWPLGINYEIKCFIPALKELLLRVETNTSLTGYRMRFRVLRCRMNDVLRIRWGLPHDAPQDLVERVNCGLW